VASLGEQVKAAEASGQTEISVPLLPTPVTTGHARTLFESFENLLGAQEKVKTGGDAPPKKKRLATETLLVKTNFHGVDYAEERRVSLTLPDDAAARLPSSLRAPAGLRPHQLHGIAWFQHLVSRAPHDCRGALLADDMGLGKTLQLLTLLAQYYEKQPEAAPSLILAPKSLLENWDNECTKFFTPSFPNRLVLYGDALQERRQPVGLIDQALRDKGVIELLRPNWVGNSKLIITTYEMLTHYEFSFARQPFAFIICDEAQRIKTPGTQVTLAVKKLKADFRIACTGTPVENSLADLWCLFDFVQPGLLGFLEDFGKVYRRPIECQNDEQHAALARLQQLILPQTLRRTKADLAGEFKRKLFGHKRASDAHVKFKEKLEEGERLEIAMTPYQDVLYKGGLKKMQDASTESDGRKRARLTFGALHHMKAVCAEPYCLPGSKFLVDGKGIDTHLANSPKMAWLLAQLQQVKDAGEKAIVFTELRETQLALLYFLKRTFALHPTIINGDSNGRQKSIDVFSAGDGFNVIILSTLAAGAGLNVTAANHVFHYTRAWNPAKENQATDRAYRIGQTRDVHVYCPTVVTDFPTFEVRVDEIMVRKSGLADSTIDGSGMSAMLNGSGTDATFAELMDGEKGKELPVEYFTMDHIDRMDGFSFEVLCEMLWTKLGYLAAVTPKKGGDGGIDVVALRGSSGELLQCKSSINGPLGWDAVKEVAGGAAGYELRFANTTFEKVAVTNKHFNANAHAKARESHVRLVERDELARILGAHPITNRAFDSRLIECSTLMYTS
jgi:SNF2 family DNA or RNA helicase